MNIFNLFKRKLKPAAQTMLSGWNAPKADVFLLSSGEALSLARQIRPGLIRWGGTVSQHKEEMGDIDKLVSIAKDINAPVVYTADLYDSTPAEVMGRIMAHVNSGVKVVGVELGNESYLPQYRNRILSPSDYIERAHEMRNMVKRKLPGMPCGIVIAPSVDMRDPDSSLTFPSYLLEWNRIVLAETWPDAVVLHSYVNPQKSGPDYMAHANAVKSFLGDLSKRRVWLTEVGVQGTCTAQERYDHRKRMLGVASSSGNVDVFVWHSLVGGGENAAIHATGKDAELTGFGKLIVG